MCSLTLFHSGKTIIFEAATNTVMMIGLRRWLLRNRDNLDGGVMLPCEHEVVTLRQRRGTWYLCWGEQVVRSQWGTAKTVFAQVCEYEIRFEKEHLR